ncbi:TPA: hypothetical protein PJF92_000114 [Escherichia coli]|nr:hypothetical protein [Escherichia coli]HDH7160053.1 hypothetical protein [Escherichia coli]
MMFHDIKTLYITGEKSIRMVKYELIQCGGDDYLVKVFDEQSKGIGEPKVMILVDEFSITYENYRATQKPAGFQRAITFEMPLSYEGYVYAQLQQHRNKLG